MDLHSGEVRVDASLERDDTGKLRVKAPKTLNSFRTVVLPEFVLKELRAHADDIRSAFGELPETVFADLISGTYYDPDRLSSAFYYTVRRRALPSTSLHGLRHAYSGALVAAGVQTKVRSEALGHSSTSTTDDIYTAVPHEMRVDAAHRLQAFFGPKMADDSIGS